MNRPDDLRRCLAALNAQNRQADEIIVVIGPDDNSAGNIFHQIGKGDPKWKCLNERRSSVVSSLNTGIRAAKGDIIALTDDDAAAPPGWLDLIEEHFLSNSKVGAVGGGIAYYYQMNHGFPTHRLLDSLERITGMASYRAIITVDLRYLR